MTRRILYITGTRADYGLMRSVLVKIHEHPSLSLDVVITGMHLMGQFGYTIEEVKKDNFNFHIINVLINDDSKGSMAVFIGQFIEKLTPLVKKLNPDIILLLGDRGEMLAGAIVGVYLSIPVAHIHGGEISSTVDDFVRHAITKLAHIHFPATEKSKERIISMGENPERIFVVGAPGLDELLCEPLLSIDELALKYQIDFSKPFFIVLQHPVTLETEEAPQQIRVTLEAIVSLKYQTVVIYPNADSGGRKMIEVINEYLNNPLIKIIPNIPHREYLSLLKYSKILIGNSSSGIIEAPSFALPVINIGSRQNGRERAKNVIDAPYDKREIVNSIKKALYDENFLFEVKNPRNPYEVIDPSQNIINCLVNIVINDNLLQKTHNY